MVRECEDKENRCSPLEKSLRPVGWVGLVPLGEVLVVVSDFQKFRSRIWSGTWPLYAKQEHRLAGTYLQTLSQVPRYFSRDEGSADCTPSELSACSFPLPSFPSVSSHRISRSKGNSDAWFMHSRIETRKIVGLACAFLGGTPAFSLSGTHGGLSLLPVPSQSSGKRSH